MTESEVSDEKISNCVYIVIHRGSGAGEELAAAKGYPAKFAGHGDADAHGIQPPARSGGAQAEAA